jgi:signal recognition particle receptor subunit beta
MAHLNVQERRVETTIAYVGPARSGKTTNLEQLGKREGATAIERTAELLSLSYRSREEGASRFRDCDVMVNVVAPRAAFCTLTPEAVEQMLHDVDGVVLVLDADPSARETNKTAAEMVRGATGSRRVPVVVQVNKSDLPGAVASEDIAADLGGSWPLVTATASRGEGVVETIERTLADVVDVLRGEASAPGEANGAANGSGSGERSTRAARVEGNPLLHALRQVLRETVAEKIDALEVELTRKLTDSFARAMKTAVSEAMDDAMTPRMIELRAQLDSTRRGVTELRAFVGGVLQEVTRTLAVQTGEIAELHANVAATAVKMASVETRLEELAAKDVAAEQRVEWSRALDKSGRENREYLVTAVAGLRRALDALAAETRGLDARKQVETATTAIGSLEERLATLDTLLRAMRDDSRDGAGQSTASLAKLGEITFDVQTQLNWLVDELKKRRKGWFA